MTIIVCLDAQNGMLFNNRRQSRDRVVVEDILSVSQGKKLWMNAYSYSLFADKNANITIDEHFLAKAEQNDFVFVENLPVSIIAEKIDRIIVYRWDKKYPRTVTFDISLPSTEWRTQSTAEFAGYSHEKIIREVYYRSIV